MAADQRGQPDPLVVMSGALVFDHLGCDAGPMVSRWLLMAVLLSACCIPGRSEPRDERDPAPSALPEAARTGRGPRAPAVGSSSRFLRPPGSLASRQRVTRAFIYTS
jgi:hypothetical protein